MAKQKDSGSDSAAIAFVTADLVVEIFVEAIRELRAIRGNESSDWSHYERLRDEALVGLKWCESLAQKANPTGPNVGTRQEQSPPKSPAETG